MIISVDIGTKNFGIFVVDNEHKPIYCNNVNLSPYDIGKLVMYLNNTTKELKLDNTEKVIVLVERQLPQNFIANVVQNHLEAYFKIKYDNSVVVLVDAKNKGFKRCKIYRLRKLESIEKASKYLQEQFPDFYLELHKHKKKDDISDAICQYLAYKIENNM